MAADAEYLQSQDDGEVICLICQSTIERNEPKSVCTSCNRPYHIECWEQNKGCAVYGCPMVPTTEPLSELEIPVSYWGKEKKACPSCGEEILAAALRCSHCGAIFSSARPAALEEFQEEQQLKEEKATLQRNVILVFIFNMMIFTAPLGALLGFFWYKSKKKALKSLSNIYRTLAKIGLAVGITQTLLLILFGVIFSIFRN